MSLYRTPRQARFAQLVEVSGLDRAAICQMLGINKGTLSKYLSEDPDKEKRRDPSDQMIRLFEHELSERGFTVPISPSDKSDTKAGVNRVAETRSGIRKAEDGRMKYPSTEDVGGRASSMHDNEFAEAAKKLSELRDDPESYDTARKVINSLHRQRKKRKV